MTTSNSDHQNSTTQSNHSWNEEQVDELLVHFFERELPEELRAETVANSPAVSVTPLPIQPQLVTTSRSNTAPNPHTGRFPVAGLTVSLLALMLVVGLLWNSSETPGNGFTPAGTSSQPLAEIKNENQQDNSANLAGKTPPASEAPAEALMLNTEDGPVELRTNRRWTNLKVIDAESGKPVDLMMQSLDIEVFGIDEEQQQESGPNQTHGTTPDQKN